MRIWLAFLLALLVPKVASAVTTDIISYPSSISDDKFSVTVQVASASAGTNYLRIDLFKEGTKNYFGETDSGQAWYGGSDGKQYFPVSIVAGSPTIATVSARMAEPSLADYPGPGSFKIRVRRYTASGSQGSEDTVAKDITITKTWPSPSPSVSPSPTTQSTSTPTLSPTTTPSPSMPTAPKPTIAPSPSLESASSGTVAGDSTIIDLSQYGKSPGPSPRHEPQLLKEVTLNKSRLKTVLLIGSGLVLLAISSFFGYRLYLRKIAKNSTPS